MRNLHLFQNVSAQRSVHGRHSMVANITDTHELEYGRACKTLTGLFDGCVNYEEKA